MHLSNLNGKRCGELILDLGRVMMQLSVVVGRDCQYLHRVSKLHMGKLSPRQKVKTVISGKHDMMLLYSPLGASIKICEKLFKESGVA
jgi:hypothetical protein